MTTKGKGPTREQREWLLRLAAQEIGYLVQGQVSSD
jgi:hypothetical protein